MTTSIVLIHSLRGPYSQYFILFVTCKFAPKARVLHYTRFKGLPGKITLAYSAHLQFTKKMKCCECSPSLFDKQKGPIFTTHFLYNLQMGPKSTVLHYTGLERLTRDKHSSFLGPYVDCKENVLITASGC